MPIIAKKTGGNFIPCPSGTFSAVCCDVVDLGVLKVSFGGKDKQQHKIYISWQVEEDMPDGKPFIASKRYTLSLHEKAGLRKDLESWRGRPFNEEELQGFDLEKLIGAPCFLNVLQEAKNGETYTNVKAIMKLPKTTPALSVREYIRVVDREPQDATDEGPPNDMAHIDDSDLPF